MGLQFFGASIIPDNLQKLSYAVSAEFRPSHWSRQRSVTEIRDQEVDVLPGGRYTLRLGLWPFHEFAVHFDGLAITEESVPERGRARSGQFEVRNKQSR